MNKAKLQIDSQTMEVSIAHSLDLDQMTKVGAPFLLPSVGEYGGYDEEVYELMSGDVVRNRLFSEAIRKMAPGKTVVDIGTGRDLNWAIESLRAGAKHVYAIEAKSEVFSKCQKLAEELNLGHRLTLLKGMSFDVELPEKVDLCVSETIGHIASCEGILRIFDDAQKRFLKECGQFIPSRFCTRIAAFSLPSNIKDNLGFSDKSLPYLRDIFLRMGSFFDIRVGVLNCPDSLLSDNQIFEDFNLSTGFQTISNRNINLSINRHGVMDGFLLWINLWGDSDDNYLDSLNQMTNWIPIFMPAFDKEVSVEPGDIVEASCRMYLSSDLNFPDYEVNGILRRGRSEMPFQCTSPYRGSFRKDAFYKALFSKVKKDLA